MHGQVGRYYDRLHRWNRFAERFGYGGGAAALTVHRALADPRAGGRATFTRLHHVLIEMLPVAAAPRVLDAGCGLGGTMIALAQSVGATCVGVTLSATQADTANAAAAAAGLGGRVQARVGTYDQPPSGPFDIIVAIESLAHSADPEVSVAALAGVLAAGGVLAIVDDMPEPSADAGDLAAFMRGWDCPVLWGRDAYVRACARHGLVVQAERDLTPDCRPRPEWRVRALSALNALARGAAPASVRQVLDAHRGGLALERLLRRGQVRYRLLIARRPGLQVS